MQQGRDGDGLRSDSGSFDICHCGDPVRGGYSFTYTITNPADDGAFTYETSASWISNLSDSGSTISFNVSENDSDASRTGRISLSYKSSYGTESATVTVAQNAGTAPALSVQPVAVTAETDGGAYSFSYTVTNPAADGELSCSTTADWISDFDYTTSGKVSFTVAANSTSALRSADISVYYDSSFGTLEETVAVVQDHPAGSGGGGGDVSDFVGTYTCSGMCYNEDYDGETVTEPGVQSTWTMKAYAGTNGLILSGLVPDIVDYYPTYEYYIAQASVSGSSIVIYPQFTGYYTSYYGTNLYICWVLCPKYDSGWYYTTEMGTPCTFSSTGTDTWTSDYGMFLGLSTTSSDFTGFYSYYDVFAPGLVITKTSSSTSSLTTTSAIQHPIDEHLFLHKDYLLAK